MTSLSLFSRRNNPWAFRPVGLLHWVAMQGVLLGVLIRTIVHEPI